jgi:ArsR family transcriptional regulator
MPVKKPVVAAVCSIDIMFRAFSDRTRLRILSLLQGGECCVGDLVEILGIEQPSASRHLAYLRRSGLVVVRKSKQWSYYALAPAKEPFHVKLLECLASCFQAVPQIQADRVRAREIKEAGGCCPEEKKASRGQFSKGGKPPRTDECCPS